MRNYANLILVGIFMVHFTVLFGYFLKNFDEIAYAKIDLRMEKSLELNHKDKMREFQIKETGKAEEITVLMYHRIIDQKDLDEHHYHQNGDLHDTIVTLQDFEEQMQYLKEQGFTTLTMPEFRAYMNEELDVPSKSVLITFDDGFKDNYINAYPVLKKHDFYATIFLITGNIDWKARDYNPSEAQYLSVQDINESLDVFSYYGHTHKFHQLTQNGESYLVAKKDKDVKDDIQSGFKMIGYSDAFAYPYGKYNESTIKILKELNTELAFTTKDAMASPSDSKLEIPRRGIYPETTLDVFSNLITYE